MKMRITFILLITLLFSHFLEAGPKGDNSKSSTEKQVVEIKIGEEFKMKNISGDEVSISLLKKKGKYFIRSIYYRAGSSEAREYAIPQSIKFATWNDRIINIWFEKGPETEGREGKAGAVYMINNHGEAIKVDDITNIDLTW